MIVVGDEVICVDDSPQWGIYDCPLRIGQKYTVTETIKWGNDIGVVVDVASLHCTSAWSAHRFRKVQRRNLTEWLSQKTKFEEPKRIGENA